MIYFPISRFTPTGERFRVSDPLSRFQKSPEIEDLTDFEKARNFVKIWMSFLKLYKTYFWNPTLSPMVFGCVFGGGKQNPSTKMCLERNLGVGFRYPRAPRSLSPHPPPGSEKNKKIDPPKKTWGAKKNTETAVESIWWRKYPSIYHGFIHPRWCERRISETLTVPLLFSPFELAKIQ